MSKMKNTVSSTTTPYLNGQIEMITNINGWITRQVMNTQDEQIRKALIALGWTPPNE